MAECQQQQTNEATESEAAQTPPKVGEKAIFKSLIAVDSNEQCRWAFERYMEVIHKEGYELILVHCPDKPSLPTFSFRDGHFPADKIEEMMRKHNLEESKVEGRYQNELQTKKVKYMWKVFDSDHDAIGEKILKLAKEEQVDLIVMGSRALNIFKRTILHSVSDYVMHHTTIPVMICPHKHHKHPQH